MFAPVSLVESVPCTRPKVLPGSSSIFHQHSDISDSYKSAGMNRSLSFTHRPPATLRNSAPRPVRMPGASPLAASCCRAMAKLAQRLHMLPASSGCCACRSAHDWYSAVADATRSSSALDVHVQSARAAPQMGTCRTAPSCAQSMPAACASSRSVVRLSNCAMHYAAAVLSGFTVTHSRHCLARHMLQAYCHLVAPEAAAAEVIDDQWLRHDAWVCCGKCLQHQPPSRHFMYGLGSYSPSQPAAHVTPGKLDQPPTVPALLQLRTC